MRKFLAVLALAILVAACVDGGYLFRVELDTLTCRTPMPVFTTDPATPADSVAVGCPYAVVDENGDTTVVWYEIPAATVDTVIG